MIYGDYMPIFMPDEDKVWEINNREDKGAFPGIIELTVQWKMYIIIRTPRCGTEELDIMCLLVIMLLVLNR